MSVVFSCDASKILRVLMSVVGGVVDMAQGGLSGLVVLLRNITNRVGLGFTPVI